MMNAKMMAAGGMSKKGMHKMPDGSKMKDSDMKGMKTGGMAMVMKNGKKVPAFAADGVGKMAGGGMSKKGYAAGGVVKSKVRGAGIAVRGVRPAKMM